MNEEEMDQYLIPLLKVKLFLTNQFKKIFWEENELNKPRSFETQVFAKLKPRLHKDAPALLY